MIRGPGAGLLVLFGWLLLGPGCHRGPSAEELRSHEADGLYLRASSEYLQGKFDAALATYTEVRKLRPLDPKLPAAQGEVHLSQGKLSDALEDFLLAAKLDPRRATTWSRVGFIQAQLGHDAARSSLERAVSLNPADFNALEQLGALDAKGGMLDAAVSHEVAAAKVCPPREASSLWLRAERHLLAQGKEAEATALLEQAVKGGTADAELLTELGNRLVVRGSLQEAAGFYAEAARKAPKDPTLWELVGDVASRRNLPKDAEAAFQRSLKVEDRSVVHVALARLRLNAQDSAGASAELNRALETAKGDSPSESRELAELLLQMHREKDALALLRVLVEEPEQARDTELQSRTARLARRQGDSATEAACCSRLHRVSPQVACP